jgi:putative endonuclease
MVHARRLFGNSAERQAQQFLEKKGFDILEQQYRTRFGEIDLIARDGDEIVFVEVKARNSSEFGSPEESVTPSKLKRIAAVGQMYLRKKKINHDGFRIDVIAITTEPEEIRHLIGVGG